MGWLHLWLGLPAGLIILIVCITGCIMAFEDELEPILFKQRYQVEESAKSILPIDNIVGLSQAVFPKDKVARIIIPEESSRSVEVRLGTKEKGLKTVFINPYNGEILFKGNYNDRFFETVRRLHRVLLLDEFGKVITGISCVICFFLVISGIVIWWPANKKAMKQRFKIKWDASGKRLTWDLHAVSGFYISIFLSVITLTGLVWSYDWVDNLIFKLADGKPKKEEKIKNLASEIINDPGLYQNVYQQINKIYAGPGITTINVPAKAGQALAVQKELTDRLVIVGDGAYFDSRSGELIKKQPFASLSTGSQIRKMNLPIHAGTILGWPTKLLAFLVTLFTASLPITGTLIWWKRGKKTKKSKKVIKTHVLAEPFNKQRMSVPTKLEV